MSAVENSDNHEPIHTAQWYIKMWRAKIHMPQGQDQWQSHESNVTRRVYIDIILIAAGYFICRMD